MRTFRPFKDKSLATVAPPAPVPITITSKIFIPPKLLTIVILFFKCLNIFCWTVKKIQKIFIL